LLSNTTLVHAGGTGVERGVVNYCRKRGLCAGHVRVEGSVISATEVAASSHRTNESAVIPCMMD